MKEWLTARQLGGLLALALLVGLAACAARAALAFRTAADYPNSVLVAQREMWRWTPHPLLRRDTSYRTLDPFPTVYNWYSTGFDLGPEVHANGTCILMASTSMRFGFLREEMGVTLCDTPSGRMIFVMRTLIVRVRWRPPF